MVKKNFSMHVKSSELKAFLIWHTDGRGHMDIGSVELSGTDEEWASRGSCLLIIVKSLNMGLFCQMDFCCVDELLTEKSSPPFSNTLSGNPVGVKVKFIFGISKFWTDWTILPACIGRKNGSTCPKLWFAKFEFYFSMRSNEVCPSNRAFKRTHKVRLGKVG